MVSAIDNALTGLAAATKKVTEASNNIANMTTPDYKTAQGDEVELSTEAVNLLVGKTAFKANVSVLQIASDMDKDLLGIFDEKV
jgi:flagellar hook-associated protein FlgK